MRRDHPTRVPGSAVASRVDGVVPDGGPRGLTAADLPRLVTLERELFGPSAWSEEMLREELAAPGRWYVGLDADAAGFHGGAPGREGEATSVVGPVGARPFPQPSARAGLVAYAGLWFDGDAAQVMTIGVTTGAQRRGLGDRLLGALVEHARRLGASAVLLEVRVDNRPAIGMYERAGFVVLNRRRRYYQPEDVDAFTMRLDLGSAHD